MKRFSATVVIPAIRVEPLLEKCIREVSRICPEAEIIAVLDDEAEVAKISSQAKVLVTGAITIAAKRNFGASHSTSEYLAFIDSDAYPEEEWLHRAIDILSKDRRIGAVGGPNISPPVETSSERFVGCALKSVLVTGLGNFRKTISPRRIVKDLPSCNLVVRRAEFLSIGGMNEMLFTGEDIDYCRRMVRSGRKIVYDPAVLVYHKNRNLKAFAGQRLTFGSGVFSLLREGISIPSLMLLFPAFFVLFLLSAPLIAIYPRWMWVYLSVLFIYINLVFFESIRQVDSIRDIPGVLLAILIGNLLPGVGTIATSLRLLPDLRKLYRNDL